MAYIGIDLGGTNIAVGIVNEKGNILAQTSTPTLASRPYTDLVKDMAGCILSVMSETGITQDEIESIGIGVPGVADQKDGVVIFCPNLGWHNVPIRGELQKYINKPVLIDNDATVAGLAENYAGVSAGCQSSVFLTLGTGLGGGIIINGRPWSGAHGVGSEIGHMTLAVDGVPCTCGNDGCVERYCSATAIIRMARQAVQGYPDSLILKLAEGDPQKINARVVTDAAKAGDPTAVEVFDRFARYLAITINNIICFLDPEMIVLGGGVSKAGAFLLDKVRAQLPRYLLYKSLPQARVELARLGNEAGIIGAAMLGKA